MTVQQLLSKVDELRPNTFTAERKLAWITDIDRAFWQDTVLTHERPAGLTRPAPYDENDMTRELFLPDTYCDVYEWHLCAQMSLAYMEPERYNNDTALYNAACRRLQNAWNREHPFVSDARIDLGQRRS